MNSLPVIDMIKTGQNIEKLRIEAGISVRQIQELMGFSGTHAIYKWQRGESLPTLDNIAALAVIFGVSIEEILIYK
ncbi:MAG: helix-turn-helix domain-containing protein [Oscillospiraceae bacterium]|nr:helix-turn-helix domain-containing protein [Oscillospiraceae bacterium]